MMEDRRRILGEGVEFGRQLFGTGGSRDPNISRGRVKGNGAIWSAYRLDVATE